MKNDYVATETRRRAIKVSGDRIRQSRQIRGLLREELADKVNLTTRQLVRIESDLDEPTVETVNRIAIAVGFPPAFFRQPPGPDFPMGSLLWHVLWGNK